MTTLTVPAISFSFPLNRCSAELMYARRRQPPLPSTLPATRSPYPPVTEEHRFPACDDLPPQAPALLVLVSPSSSRTFAVYYYLVPVPVPVPVTV